MIARCAPFFSLLVSITSFAETIIRSDLTEALGPDFFLDDAVVGGTDTTTSFIHLDRDFGLIERGRDGSELIISGLGWASASSGTTATQVTATISYLGADGVEGGGDDVLFGSRTDVLTFSGAGEYVWSFDTPLIASVDAANSIYRVTIITSGTGDIRFKNDDLGPKLSVAGFARGLEPLNLLRYRGVAADSNPTFARYATDGIVGSDFKWIMQESESLPQFLEVEFPGPVEVGSYHLFHGVNNDNLCTAFRLEYKTGSGWETVPGSTVTGNSLSENKVIFTPIIVERLRLRITGNGGDGRPRIREWAVFPPHADNGYPLGTGVTLNMAQHGRTEADSHTTGHAPRWAVDGSLASSWQSDPNGPHQFEVHLRDEIQIKSIHLHSGESSSDRAVADFTIEYSNDGGASWSPAPGGEVSGNTETDLVLEFSSAVAADAVRLSITDAGQVNIRELQVFPDNGLGGYPRFINTDDTPSPRRDYEEYADAFYRLQSPADGTVLKADANGAVLVAPNVLDRAQIFNVLLNHDGHTFRIFNRDSRDALAIADAALVPGARLVEETYGAFPSQRWYLRDAGDGQVYLQNVFSRLFLEASEGGAVLQQSFTGKEAQRWRIDFQSLYPKKGAAGFPEFADDMGANWFYGWTNNDLPDLNTEVVDFYPMQWGNYNWDPDRFNSENNLPLTVRFPDWYARGNPFVHMGFNEPDRPDQANHPVSTSVETWPRLMASGLPLMSPVTAQVNGQWMIDFMNEAQAREFTVDYLAMHTYIGPFPDLILNALNDLSAAYGDRPVYLTEFGFSDFANGQNWTEVQLYRQLLELLWKLEAAPNCRGYALFGFVEDEDYPQPSDPTGRARRTNWRYQNGGFTPVGELWMGWDGALAPGPDQPYILHNRGFDQRLNNDGSESVAHVDIRTGGPSAQVVFESIGNGFYYLTSLLDGRRLRQTDPTTVQWDAPETTSTHAQWSWSQIEEGWQLITNRATGDNLRFTDVQGIHMGSDSGAYYQWFFIPPMTPTENLDPLPPSAPTTAAAFRQATLEWSPSPSADLASYRVLRATAPGGPYVVVSANLFETKYTDTSLSNDQTYYYQIESVDQAGNTSSTAAIATTPVAPAPDTFANWALVAFDQAPDGSPSDGDADPDRDGLNNRLEYFFLMDPLAPSPNPLAAKSSSSGTFHLEFSINRHATDLTWSLRSSIDLANLATWPEAPFSVLSQTDAGDRRHYVIQPDDRSAKTRFYVLQLTD